MIIKIIKADICENKYQFNLISLEIMRNRILFLLCFLCVGLQAFAQISISGKVVMQEGLSFQA